jgi:RNA polymerase sigma factor (sigma-70 family)
VKEVRKAARAVTSLDRPLGTDSDASLGDVIATDDHDFDEEIHVGLTEETLRRAVEGLSEREQDVLRMRYGMDDDDPKSLDEIGRRLGLTRERVRQIEAQALQRLAVNREVEALRSAA